MTASIASYSPGHTWRRSGSLESIYSIQGRETDVVADTTDTESDSDKEGVEYEPVTDTDNDLDIDDSSGASDSDIIRTRVIEVSVGDDGELQLADSERTPESSDSELDYHDYWHCAACRATNNDPTYRYCQKCFKVRKNLFPPRPRRKAKRVEPPPQLSQDSGIDMTNELTHSQKSDLTPSQSELTPSQSELTSSQSELTSSQSKLPASQELSQSQSELSQSQSELSQSQSERPQSELSQSRTRKRKHTTDGGNPKRSRHSAWESESDSDSGIVTSLHKTLSDPAVTVATVSESDKSDMCITCLAEPKSGVFVHGRIAHICCCYRCAIKVWRKAKRCPICNSKVSNVLKAVVM